MPATLLQIVDSTVIESSIATALALFIGGFGLWRGLSLLEAMERITVEGKLSIIAALLMGLLIYNYILFVGLSTVLPGSFESVDETGIIDLSSSVASVLPFALIVGAAKRRNHDAAGGSPSSVRCLGPPSLALGRNDHWDG